MMDSSSQEESEAHELRNQLSVYQKINGDLSKKIQELKIELNVTQKELLKTQNELLTSREMLIQEQRKFEELKRFYTSTNGLCIDFFKKYHDNLEKLNNSELDLSLNLRDVSQNNSSKLEN
jgi:GTP1/Obg family GTP-binding protein